MAWPQGGGYGRGRGRMGPGGGRGGWRWSQGFQPFQQPSVPPPPPNALRVCAPVLDNMGADSTIAQMLARTPMIAVVDIVQGRLAAVYVVPNPVASMRGGAGPAFAQVVSQLMCRAVIAPSTGPRILSALQGMGIAVYNAPPGARLVDVLRSLGLVLG